MAIVSARLTGRQRYRSGWFGKIILQVEEHCECEDNNFPYSDAPPFDRWRDANLDDLLWLLNRDSERLMQRTDEIEQQLIKEKMKD